MKDLKRGLEILLSYEFDHPSVSAEHDVLYLGGPEPTELTLEDSTELERLGISWDTGFECWSMFT